MYLSLYFNDHIIVVALYYCVGIPRWVLDHFLGYVLEVPLEGRNLIFNAFNLCHPIYFLAHLLSPFILLHLYVCVGVCVCVCVDT